MSISLADLKTELQTDPTGLGYAAPIAAGNHSLVASIINQVRTSIRIDRGVIPSHEVVAAIVPNEWGSLTQTEKDRIAFIVSAGEVDSQAANVRSAFIAAFGAPTTTRANLVALQTRDGSRAEQLFGAGVTIGHEDIGRAINS